MADVSKRILAETPDVLFWEFKAKAAELQLTQKDLVLVAVWKFIDSELPLDQLFEDPKIIAKLQQLELDKGGL